MLDIRRLSVGFDTGRALDGFDLTVAESEVVAVMGPSGSGKSTLLRVIAGLQQADAGTVVWDGRDLEGVPPHRRRFGLMFQDYALFPHKTVAGNVGFGLKMQDRSGDRVAAGTDEALTLVGLAGSGDRSIGSLSGGEQQRVALARTLAPRPRLLLLDEPIGALDLALREHLMVEMRDIFETISATVLYVTHDRSEAFAVADRVAVVADGRVVALGTPQDLWTAPGSEFVARFLGMENVYPVVADSGVVDTGWLRIPGPSDATAVAIPPDAISLSNGPDVTGRVVSVRFQAGAHRVTLRVGYGATLMIETQEAPTVGASVAAGIDVERVAFLTS